MSPRVRRPVSVVVAVLASTVLLAGCGGDDSSQARPAADSTPAAKASTLASGQGPGDSGGAIGSGGTDAAAAEAVSAPQPQPAAGDLANFSCEQRRRMWSASGDVSNPGKEPMVYTVTVVTIAGAEVTGDESTKLVLKPGDTEHFELPGVGSGPADTCMPRVVRTPR